MKETFADFANSRENNFDFLRFFFASLVIFSHSFPILINDSAEPLHKISGRLEFGSTAVFSFFSISGFLITKSWLRQPNLREFFRHRALRIYPGWIVALLFCVLIVAPIARPSHSLALGQSGTYSFFDQLVLHNNGVGKRLPGVFVKQQYHEVDGSLWTIPYEVMCYFFATAFGLGGFFLSRKKYLKLFYWTTLLILSVLYFIPGRPTHIHAPYLGLLDQFPPFLLAFLAGSLFYLYQTKIPFSRLWFMICVILCCSTAFIRALSPLSVTIFLTCWIYIIFYVAFSNRIKLQRFGKYGDFSYGLYLYAWPVQQLLTEYFHDDLTPIRLFFLSWLLAGVLAVLSWHIIERPALRLKYNKASPVTAGQPLVAAEPTTLICQ